MHLRSGDQLDILDKTSLNSFIEMVGLASELLWRFKGSSLKESKNSFQWVRVSGVKVRLAFCLSQSEWWVSSFFVAQGALGLARNSREGRYPCQEMGYA
ncbi:hypothetical protein AVEN_269790-1 [Araneus ventricosus]|uniref:Uncharacterized protein n=1 Tax=Araneus ventricosus TaxID=182803 RepID=A0A4Y2PG33_ARAVE|nr:hypothetical protein AVEN_269790-1 [Araneus ventricosus]